MMGSRFSAMSLASRFLKTPSSPPRSAGLLSPRRAAAAPRWCSRFRATNVNGPVSATKRGGGLAFFFSLATSGLIMKGCVRVASSSWKRRASKRMGLLRSFSIPGVANGICCSRPAELLKRDEFRPGDLGAPDPVLGARAGRPVSDCLFTRLYDNPVRRRHCSRLSSRPGRAQTSKVRIQSPRRVASYPHGFRPDRRPFFYSRRPGARRPIHRLRSTLARLRDAVAGDRGRGGQRIHCEIRWPLVRRLGAAAAIVERANPEIGRRLRRGRRTMASRRVDTAGVRWGGAIQFSVAPHRHARRRLLYSRRLAQDDRKARLLAPARPSRISAKNRPRNKPRIGGLHPWPVDRLPFSRDLVQCRLDADRSRLWFSDWRRRRPFELRALCRVSDRAGAFA